jgi:hypothetical protein
LISSLGPGKAYCANIDDLILVSWGLQMSSLPTRAGNVIDACLAALANTTANLKTQMQELDGLRDRIRKARLSDRRSRFRLSDDKGLSTATNGPAELSRFVGRTSVKAASVGAVRNSSFPRANRALSRIDLVSCQHGLLHSGEARSVAGRAGMLFDLRRHDEPFRLPSVRGLFPLCG